MLRDYNRDITIMVAGTGRITAANFKDNLTDFILGAVDDPNAVGERELTVILPILERSGPVLDLATAYAMTANADTRVFQVKGAPMNRDLAKLDDIVKAQDEHEALKFSFELLEERKQAGDETFVLLAYDPNSSYTQGQQAMSDLELLYEVKAQPNVTVLNINGMIDSFEGYESAEDKAIREAAEAEFAAKVAEEEAAAPKPARKAAAPRKRAAKKAVASSPAPALAEPEKPLQDVPERVHEPLCALRKNHAGDCRIDISSTPADLAEYKIGDTVEVGGMTFTKHSELPGLDKLIDDAVKRDPSLKAQSKEFYEIGPDGVPTLDEMLGAEPPNVQYSEIDIRMAELSLVTPEDVWSDVAKARPAAVESRQEELFIQLGENIAQMSEVFSQTIRTYAALGEEIRNG